jgi:mannose-1-phosphate guanylyltransferase/phosphomannomutase
MKAVIMAGGEGTRLRPLTYNQPKPMIPMGNRALMEHVVALLRRHGIYDIVVTVAFQANAVRTYFGNGSEFGVRMSYVSESSPLGTAGSVTNAREELKEPFLVISGDVLTDMDLSAVIKFHKDKGALATLGLKSVPNPLEFGIVMTREDGSVDRFLEKPSWGEVFSDTINTGIYVFEPAIFDYIPAGQADFSSDVFPRLLSEGAPLCGCVTDCYWEDVGTLEAYTRAHQDILDGRVQVDVPGFSMAQGIWLGEGAEIDPKAEIIGPALIGDYCRVEAGAVLGEYTVLGRNVRVGADAYLERVVVHDNAYLGPGVQLRGCTVGRSSDLRRGARLEEGVVIGDECFIGEHAVLHPDVKVYPFKTVEHGAVVNSSIVWESRGARNLFGRHGVSGLANVDVSPELVTRLAMAYATTMQRGASVSVSRDASRAARMLKRAVTVGLNAAGVDVADLEIATVPVTRLGVRHERSAGGVTVRLSSDDPHSVLIRFFDSKGIDLTETAQRKVERIFFREDFRRSLGAEIGDVTFPVRVPEYYSHFLLEHVDVEAIRAARFKVVLDYAYGATSFVMPTVLGRMGADVLSINPYVSARQSASFDRWEHARGVAALVRAAGAHFGAVLDPDGERMTLVDDSGRVLSDAEGLLALLGLVLAAPDVASAPVVPGHGPQTGRPERSERFTVALPVSVPRAAETMCEQAGARLIWTKLSTAHLMEIASRPGVDFAAGQEGGYMFPDFLPAYDAVAALVHTFALLTRSGTRLSQVVAGLPPVFSAHEGVVTPWEKKGLVMRSVIDFGKGLPLVLVDGVKIIYKGGWTLVVPDPEEALTHVLAEGPTEAVARQQAGDCARRIRNLLRA